MQIVDKDKELGSFVNGWHSCYPSLSPRVLAFLGTPAFLARSCSAPKSLILESYPAEIPHVEVH
jgi:hypothetical protein